MHGIPACGRAIKYMCIVYVILTCIFIYINTYIFIYILRADGSGPAGGRAITDFKYVRMVYAIYTCVHVYIQG